MESRIDISDLPMGEGPTPQKGQQFGLATKILENKLERPRTYFFDMIYHDLPLRVWSNDRRPFNFFEKFIPQTWRDQSYDHVEVFFYSSELHGDVSWFGEDANSDCTLYTRNYREIAIQRDFIGVEHNPYEISVVCDFDSSDAYHNILRWILPRRLFARQSIILHSSTVLGSDQKAHIFLGHSGAGKSTLASLADGRLVLGDDMNILSYDNHNFSISAAAIGGMITNFESLDRKFPISRFYWLKKGKKVGVRELSAKESVKKHLVSFANLFWGQYSSNLMARQAMRYAIQLSRLYPMVELTFDKNTEFWSYVDGSNSKKK